MQSFGATCAASSTQAAGHPAAHAADDDCRTWWSAETGNAGEWFEIDLGSPRRVNALQVNFAAHETDAKSVLAGAESHRYRLTGSLDGRDWFVLRDRATSRGGGPHDYLELAEARTVRRLRVEKLFTPAAGKFALSDLRMFGHAGGEPPPAVEAPELVRHADDDRNATIRWRAVPGADGYLVRFGVARDALHHCLQVQGGGMVELTTHALTRGVNYHWRVDAFSANGLTPGKPSRRAL